MDEFIRKLKTIQPAFPRRRYTIFTGTNTLDEWWMMLASWLVHEDPDLHHEEIRRYEETFAQTVGAKHAISFGAGRMAFFTIMDAMDIGPGDEVILPAFTCVVVPNAVLYRGATPVWVDIDPVTFNINTDLVKSAITTRTRALYAQHTFGVVSNLDEIKEIGRQYGLPVIEDCGHALGAIHRGKPVGGLTNAAYFTTDHSKITSTHLGGMATTNDDALAEKLRRKQIAAPFLTKKQNQRLLRTFLLEYLYFSPSSQWIGKSIHAVLGRIGASFYFLDENLITPPTAYPYPCRLSAQQSRLGLSQLMLLGDNLRHRRQIAGWLESRIGWYGFSSDRIESSSWLRYSFLVRNRKAFEQHFHKRFDLGIWFTSIAGGRTKNFNEICYRTGSCPVAELVAEHIVNFPTHPRIPFEIIKSEVDRELDWIHSAIMRPENI